MFEYVYSYKSDSTNEPIGKVIAITYEDAVDKISEIKKLPITEVLNLFSIKIKN